MVVRAPPVSKFEIVSHRHTSKRDRQGMTVVEISILVDEQVFHRIK